MTDTILSKTSINDILFEAVIKKASDVHLVVGKPPVFRINGSMTSQGTEILTPDDTVRLAYETMNEQVKGKFDEEMEADYSYSIEFDGVTYRFRVNSFTQRGAVSAVFRLIPNKILTVDELKLPEVLHQFIHYPRGLVLFTGPTGSGKSTSLAAIIDGINRQRDVHIVTLEDPIEFLHQHKKAVINQREIGQDSHSFKRALKSILRQDPDVILLGEMRDLETIGMAVTLAETGHLVFATLHTTSASQTIDRIIDVFPPEQQEQIRVQLSNTLEGIVSQTLLPKIDGKGRVCATEILLMTSAARSNVRNGKSNALNDVMQTGASLGMHTLEQDLATKVKQNTISVETAFHATSRPDILKQMLMRSGIKVD